MDVCHDPLVRCRWYRRVVEIELRRACRMGLDQIILLHVDEIGECCRLLPWRVSVALLQQELQLDGDVELELLCTEAIALDGAA
jgi:hypothetical protein